MCIRDSRVGRIAEVYVYHEERSLQKFQVKVDFGDAGMMNGEIELTDNYNADALEGRLVIAIVNVSTSDTDEEAIILKIASNDGKDVLIRPDWEVPPEMCIRDRYTDVSVEPGCQPATLHPVPQEGEHAWNRGLPC